MPSSASRGGWREAAKRAAEQHRVLRDARPGAIYTLKDELVDLPEHEFEGHPPRTFHKTRRVIVVQARQWAVGADPLTILVVPCTAHPRGEPAPWEFAIPEDEPGFTEEGVVALIALLQPVRKVELGRKEATLRPPTLLQLQARVAAFLGLQPAAAPIQIPARPSEQPLSQSTPAAPAVAAADPTDENEP